MPGTVSIKSVQPSAGRKVYLWGYDKLLDWSINGKRVIVKIPRDLLKAPVCEYARVFKFPKQIIYEICNYNIHVSDSFCVCLSK